MNICQQYEISSNQLYTFTTDNAKNMIKTSELLSSHCEEEKDTNSTDDDSEVDNTDNRNDIFDDEDFNSSIVRSKSTIFESIKCMVHTLQLAINDVLQKSQKYSKIISKALEVVIKLRTPNILSMLKTRKLKKPVRNVITRWSSTYNMIQRLIYLKPFCKEMEEIIKELHLKSADWDKLEEISTILKYTYDATIRLQSEQLLLSEAYGIIYKCKLQLHNKKNIPFANDLLLSLKQRTDNAFSKCGPLLGAVFLDPRYQSLLTISEKRTAKEHLNELYKHILSLTDSPGESQSDLDNQNKFLNVSKSNSGCDSEVVLITYLQKNHDQKNIQSASSSFSDKDNNILLLLDSFDEMELMPMDTNVLNFWSSSKMDPRIAKLAKIALAVPGTQVSVERLFSLLKWILSEKRNNIDEDILEDTLLIIVNKEVDDH